MKKIKVKLVFAMVLSLFFTALTPGLNIMAEENNNQIDESDYLVDDSTVSEANVDLFDDDSTDKPNETEDNAVAQPAVAPLVPIAIGTVVRLVTKWAGKKAVKKVTKHAAERAGQRSISSSAFAKAMANGTKYVDKNTGAKILYNPNNKVALVLDKAGKTVVTTYKQTKPKGVWKKNGW